MEVCAGRGLARRRSPADVRRERFTALWIEHEAVVTAVVRGARVDDPDGLIGEVSRKAWEAFGATARRERERRKEGWAGYNWRAWFVRVAERVVIDARRR